MSDSAEGRLHARLQTARRVVLAAIVMLIPLVIAPRFTLDPFNVPKLALLMFGLGLVAGLYLLGWAAGERILIPRAAWVVPLSIVVPLVVAWGMSPLKAWSLFGAYSRFQGLIPYLAFALLSVAIAHCFRGGVEPLAWALAIAGGGVGLYQVLQMVGLDVLASGSRAAMVPSTASTLGNSNFVGGFLAIVFPLALHLWIRGGKSRVAGMVLTILIAEGIIMSFSKGAQAAAVAAAIVLLGFHVAPRSPRGKRAALIAAALVALGLVGAILASGLRPGAIPTATSRLGLWKVALGVAGASPIWGHGPNGYFLERTAYRTAEDAVARRETVPAFTPVDVGYQASDDPHSVPLSFLANAGIIGVAGFLIAAGWLIKRWTRLASSEQTAAAFYAASIAYLVQGLVSVDEPALRLAGWASIGGLVAGSTGPGLDTVRTSIRRTHPLLATGAALSALLVIAVGAWWSYGFVRSDRLALTGTVSFMQDDPHSGRRDLIAALSFRDDYIYRQSLAEHLGLSALSRGRDAAALVGEMQEINGYLKEFPSATAMLGSARILKYWTPHDGSAAISALDLLERAGQLDPNNPLVEVEQAELLLDLGREEEARQLLEPLIDTPAAGSPDVWGSLAVARLAHGDARGARIAADASATLATTACRSQIANELVELETDGLPTRGEASTTAFNLMISCDQGMFDFFRRRVSVDARALYGS